jgi:hypothetical protein
VDKWTEVQINEWMSRLDRYMDENRRKDGGIKGGIGVILHYLWIEKIGID